MSSWCVYLVRCADGSLYTGITTNLSERVAKHNAGDGAKYTRSHAPVRLVWSKPVASEGEARSREAEIKGWTKLEKERLVADATRFTLRRSMRARRVRITVHPGGEVIVTAPHGVHEQDIATFVGSKRPWIARAVQRLSRRTFHPDIVDRTRAHFERHGAAALALVASKVAQWNARFGFRFNAVRVKRQKATWGSCSSKRNLQFNYKILFLPEPLQDYIIVHELCHLSELNHSPQFWSLVSQACPDHRSCRRLLRAYA